VSRQYIYKLRPDTHPGTRWRGTEERLHFILYRFCTVLTYTYSTPVSQHYKAISNPKTEIAEINTAPAWTFLFPAADWVVVETVVETVVEAVVEPIVCSTPEEAKLLVMPVSKLLPDPVVAAAMSVPVLVPVLVPVAMPLAMPQTSRVVVLLEGKVAEK
jgi:hypothetical protein